MSDLNDIRAAAATEHRAQFTTGTLTITPRRDSVRRAGVGGQALEPLEVPAMDAPESSFGLGAGGGEASMLTRRYRVWAEDLVQNGEVFTVGSGCRVEFRQRDADGVPTGAPVVATVVETSTALGGRAVMLECQIDRGSGE